MTLFVVHEADEKIRCAFNTLVIKAGALEKLYKGGLHGFMEKYGGRCNSRITVWCDMGSEFNDTVRDLIDSGLTMDEDFTFLDVGSYVIAQSIGNRVDRRNHVDLGVDWLKARYVNGGIYVWYAEGR